MKTKISIVLMAFVLFSISTAKAQQKEVKTTAHKHVEKGMYVCPMHADIKSEKPGTCSICKMDLKKMEQKTDSTKMKHKLMKQPVYSCPMHADIKSNKPANCSKCGMKLVLKKETKDTDQKK